MTAKNYLCKILKQEAFILGGVSVLIAAVTYLASSWRDYHVFKNSVIRDIAELKIITRETKIAVEAGNKENLQRDIDLKLWMTRLDQKLNDSYSHRTIERNLSPSALLPLQLKKGTLNENF